MVELNTRIITGFSGIAAALVLAGCGWETVDVNIGGNVTGLAGGTQVVLADNGSDRITISASGPFTFDQQVASGKSYAVTVATQPVGETCTVSNGSGTVDGQGDNVTNISVACTQDLSSNNEVFGIVSGLTSGTLSLQNNGSNTLSIAANGEFVFSNPLPAGTAYNVTVLTNPSGQTCTVANGSGVMPSSGTIPNVVVTCS